MANNEAVTGAELVAQALTWVGTPYHHAACCKGAGVDCARLLEGVGKELGFEIQVEENYRNGDNYKLMCSVIETYCDRREDDAEPEAGDILVFRSVGMPQHVGIYDGADGFIHAYSSVGAGIVCVSNYDDFWKSKQKRIYRFKGVTG